MLLVFYVNILVWTRCFLWGNSFLFCRLYVFVFRLLAKRRKDWLLGKYSILQWFACRIFF